MAASDTPSAEQNKNASPSSAGPAGDAAADDPSANDASEDDSSSGIGCMGMIGILFLLGVLGNLVDDDGSGETASTSESSTCQDVRGIYAGTYSGASPVGYKTGNVGLVVEKNCEFTVVMDGQRMGDGTLEKEHASSYLFPSGVAVEFSTAPGGTSPESATWVETGNGFRITYRLRRMD